MIYNGKSHIKVFSHDITEVISDIYNFIDLYTSLVGLHSFPEITHLKNNNWTHGGIATVIFYFINDEYDDNFFYINSKDFYIILISETIKINENIIRKYSIIPKTVLGYWLYETYVDSL